MKIKLAPLLGFGEMLSKGEFRVTVSIQQWRCIPRHRYRQHKMHKYKMCGSRTDNRWLSYSVRIPSAQKHLEHRRLKLPTSVVVRGQLSPTRRNTKYVDIFLCTHTHTHTHTHTQPLDIAWLHSAVGDISVWNKPLKLKIWWSTEMQKYEKYLTSSRRISHQMSH